MRKNDQPTRSTILGTLVDRAVSMPFSRPQVLRAGHRRLHVNGTWVTGTSICDDVRVAADGLSTALRSYDGGSVWPTAQFAVDANGPWGSALYEQFFDMAERDRRWVLDRLADTAETAAVYLKMRAVDDGWSWLWSQPTFAQPGKLRPSLTRPDLVAGLDWKRCIIIDIKSTGKTCLRDAIDATTQQRTFDDWAERLRLLRFCPLEGQVLAVSTEQDLYEWFVFTLSENRVSK